MGLSTSSRLHIITYIERLLFGCLYSAYISTMMSKSLALFFIANSLFNDVYRLGSLEGRHNGSLLSGMIKAIFLGVTKVEFNLLLILKDWFTLMLFGQRANPVAFHHLGFLRFPSWTPKQKNPCKCKAQTDSSVSNYVHSLRSWDFISSSSIHRTAVDSPLACK